MANIKKITLDTTAPTGNSISITADYTASSVKYINGNAHAFTIAATSAYYMRIWDSSVSEPSTWMTFSTSYSLISAMLTSGSHTVYLRTMDNVGNESSTTSVTYTVDSSAPTSVSGDITNTDDVIRSGESLSITASASDSVTGIKYVYVYSTGLLSDGYTRIAYNSNSTYSNIAISASAADGAYTVSIAFEDNVGNLSSQVSIGTVILDTTDTEVGITVRHHGTNVTITTTNSTNAVDVYLSFTAGAGTPDIVAIKVWADNTTKPSSWTYLNGGEAGVESYLVQSVAISQTEGTHYVYVDYKALSGDVGSDITLESYGVMSSFIVATTAPTCSLSTSNTYYASGVSPTFNIQYGANVSSASITYSNGSTTKTDTISATGQYTPTGYGSYTTNKTCSATLTIRRNVQDSTGATTYLERTATCTYYIDVVAPDVNFTGSLNSYYNSINNISLEYSVNDTFLDHIYAWVSISNSTSEAVPSGTSISSIVDQDATGGYVATLTKNNVGGLTDIVSGTSTYYIHLKVYDGAGNYTQIVSSGFKFDTGNPEVAVTFEATTVNTDGSSAKTINARLTYRDTATGLSRLTWTGSGITLVNNVATSSSIAFSKDASTSSNTVTISVTITGSAGQKSLYITAYDKAGNSTTSAVAVISADGTTPTVSMNLYETEDGDTAGSLKTSPSSSYMMIARITSSDTSYTASGNSTNTPPMWYRVYGDIGYGTTQPSSTRAIASGIEVPVLYSYGVAYSVGQYLLHNDNLYIVTTAITTTDIASTIFNSKVTDISDNNSESYKWRKYTKDSGQSYMNVSLSCTTNPTNQDENKTVSVEICDVAGHIKTTSVTFWYTVAEPTVSISNLTYNMISAVTSERRSGASSTISGTANNKITFTITPNEYIKSYKVCAFNYTNMSTLQALINTSEKIADLVHIDTANGSSNTYGSPYSMSSINVTLIYADLIAYGLTEGLAVVAVFVQDYAGQWNLAQTVALTDSDIA